MAKYYDTSKFSSASSYEEYLEQLSSYESSKSATKKGYQMSSADLASLYADYYSTQDERAYNEYYYNTYESPSALVQQYQEAGLNPALMYGSSATSSTNVSSGYNGASRNETEQSDFQNLMQVLQLVMTGSQIGSQVMLNKSQAHKNEADANATERATVGSDFQSSITREYLDLARDANERDYQRLSNETKEVASSIELNNWKSRLTEVQSAEVHNSISLANRQFELAKDLNQATIDRLNSEVITNTAKRILMANQGNLLQTMAELNELQKSLTSAQTALTESSTAYQQMQNLGLADLIHGDYYANIAHNEDLRSMQIWQSTISGYINAATGVAASFFPVSRAAQLMRGNNNNPVGFRH